MIVETTKVGYTYIDAYVYTQLENVNLLMDGVHTGGAKTIISGVTVVPEFTTPMQLSPVDGSVFDHYSRMTTLRWTAVPGATSVMSTM